MSKKLKEHSIGEKAFYDLLVEVKEKPLAQHRTFVDDLSTAYHTYKGEMFLSDKQLYYLMRLNK